MRDMSTTPATHPSPIVAASAAAPTHNAADEARLLRRVARGDHSAYEALYNAVYPSVLKVTGSVLRNPSAAEDAAQETLVYVWRRADRFDPQRGSARSWIMTIAQSRAIDVLRRDRRHDDHRRDDETAADRLPAAQDVEFEVSRDDAAGAVRSSLQQLPRAQRDALFLAYFAGLTQQEIADRTHEPIGTVKGRVRLGLAKLHRELEQRGALAA